MTHEQRQLLLERIQIGLQVLWGLTFFLFPLFFATFTTEGIVFPKEMLLAVVVLVSLVVWGVQMVVRQQVRLRRTPLDIPILLFVVAVILSSVFSIDRIDSLTTAAGVVYAALSYFILVNAFPTRKVAYYLLSCLLAGGVVASLITVLAHYKVYVLPFASTKLPTFSPLGTYLEFAVYTVLLLPVALHYVLPALKNKINARVGVFGVVSLVLIAGLIFAAGLLLTSQKPTLLPFDTGFQTAFAAVSQDSGRILQTFLFGEGYGNFSTVFSRFHTAALNANQQLWFLSFNNSSSYLLELLATTGFVGVVSFLFLAYKALLPVANKKHNPLYLSLIGLFIISAILPFSFIEVALLFFFLAGFTLCEREAKPQDYFDIELQFVALKKGVFAFTTLGDSSLGKPSKNQTPVAALVVLLAFVLLIGFYSTAYALSDITFQSSLSAANANNGTATYRLQTQAMSMFPYRSVYYRVFSQTNIALANSLLALTSNHSSPSATTQQTAFTLIQQAITTARQATTLAPANTVEWQNLSSVYRSLIGVGQNAQDFAIQSAQQATVLDSANPQEYLNLGGMYYQIGQYDNAIRMFQQAITLKNDYANAYYNLGHAYEQKQDYTDALSNFQSVKQLVASDPTNEQKISQEIAALQAKGGSGSQAAPTAQTAPTGQQQPLSLPPTAAPVQNQSGQIPLVSPTPAK